MDPGRGYRPPRDAVHRDLTDVYLRSLKPPVEGRLEVWDVRVPGLALRLTSSGVATWCVRARTHDGKRTALVSGDGPPLASKRLAPGRAWRWVKFRVVATRSRRSARRRPNARQGFRNRAWPSPGAVAAST